MMGALLCAAMACRTTNDGAVPGGGDAGTPSRTLLTLNLANGAGDTFRTPEARQRQAAFVADAGADIAAWQEVDLNVERSGYADVSREVAAIDCSLAQPEFTPDGARVCTGNAGTVVFGRAFQGDDPYDADGGTPSGILDDDTTLNPTSADRSAAASFGNAVFLRGAMAVKDAYVVELPTTASEPPGDPLWTRLAASPVPDDARAELATRNRAARMGPAIEPRIVLVVRTLRANGSPLSILVTHLEAGEQVALRAQQLQRVLAVAQAERTGPPAREVVVLGDFNQSVNADESQMSSAAFLAATAQRDGIDGIDQIWVDSSLTLLSSDSVPTGGVSDHPFASRAVVE